MRLVADDIMYAVDILDHRILAINLNTSSVTVVYRTRDDRRPYTLAVGQQYIYFSAWNRKLVRVLLRLSHFIFSLNTAQHFMRRYFTLSTECYSFSSFWGKDSILRHLCSGYS